MLVCTFDLSKAYTHTYMFDLGGKFRSKSIVYTRKPCMELGWCVHKLRGLTPFISEGKNYENI